MKTIKAVRAYKLMQSIKPNAMDGDSQMKYIKIMRVLRPIAENYEKNVEEGTKTLQDENFEEMRQKAIKHDEAVQNKTQEGLLCFTELEQVRSYIDNYNKSVNKLMKELNDEEVSVSLGRLSEEAFKKLSETIKVNGEELVLLADVILE